MTLPPASAARKASAPFCCAPFGPPAMAGRQAEANNTVKIRALTAIWHSFRGIGGGDHNRAGKPHPNCETGPVTRQGWRDAVHGFLPRKALVRPSPIN